MRETLLEAFAPNRGATSVTRREAIDALEAYPATGPPSPRFFMKRGHAYQSRASACSRREGLFRQSSTNNPLADEAKPAWFRFVAGDARARKRIRPIPRRGDAGAGAPRLFYDAHKWKEARL